MGTLCNDSVALLAAFALPKRNATNA